MYAQHIIDKSSTQVNSARACISAAAAQENWEAELDAMGTEASVAEYEAHLAKAPDERAEMTQYLKGFVAAKSQPF